MLNKDLHGIEKKPTHKRWLDNEYSEWVKALNEYAVVNFKESPTVKRMLSLDLDFDTWFSLVEHKDGLSDCLFKVKAIDGVGSKEDWPSYGLSMRYVYYAQQILKLNPLSITEIGGGVGQFYAILRALGYKGEYFIADLHEVVHFQKAYLAEVERQTGLSLPLLAEPKYDFCCSFYALGEFDDETKKWYVENVVNKCKGGYIAWNAHSGATDNPEIIERETYVTKGIEEGIKIIQW